MTTEHDDDRSGRTPLTPPAASATPQGPSQPEVDAPRRSGSRAVMIITSIVGGIALLGSGGAAAAQATGTYFGPTADRAETVQREDASGLEAIDLDADGGDMRIEFGDVDQAQLSVANGRGPQWTLDRDGDTLVVRSPEFRFGWWFGSWFGDEESAVLTLPSSLRDSALDADLTLDAGSLDARGDFGAIDVDISAGSLDLEGAATSLDIGMSAGRADVLLDGVTRADLGISAGNLAVELTGTAPTSTSIDASAGSVDLTVPDVAYAITQDISAGTLDATVEQSSDARRAIAVTLSAGTVTVRPGR